MQSILSLAGVVLGAALSWVFEFFPGVKSWHKKLTPRQKALFHSVMSFLLGMALLAMSCVQWFAEPLHLSCLPFDTANIFLLFLAVFGGDQGHYLANVKFRPKGDGAKG